MDWQRLLEQQPTPEGTGEPVWLQVYQALHARITQGERKHGRLLHTHNGRDPLADALQEQVDGLQYLVQALMEREERQASFEERLQMACVEIEGWYSRSQRRWGPLAIMRHYFGDAAPLHPPNDQFLSPGSGDTGPGE